MATIEKLKSGNYRIKKTVNGVTYRKTVSFKPKKTEADQMISEMVMTGEVSVERMSVNDAIDRYIDSKDGVLSPATIRNYIRYKKQFPQWFMLMRLSSVTEEQTQRMVKEISKVKKSNGEPRSEKYIENLYGLVSASFEMFRPKFKPDIDIPRTIKESEPYIPTDSDVKALLQAAKGTRYEIPIALAALGLRRGEICGLTIDDLKGNELYIKRDIVQDKDEQWVVSTTKTRESVRKIVIPDTLADRIREQGYVYNGFPGSIYNYMRRTLKKLGIPFFGVHKLRHYFVTFSTSIGIPVVNILAMGGWKTDQVMKTVYRHLDRERAPEMQAKATNHLAAIYDKSSTKSSTEED